MKIDIYTDGSCIGNPGPGGWGAILIFPDEEIILDGAERDTTNNRMEMMAMIKALEYLRTKTDISEAELLKLDINIFSDSNLLVQTFKQNWKRKKNLDLWAQLDHLTAWLNIKWHWVKAHHTNSYNNRVDKLANDQARKIAGNY